MIGVGARLRAIGAGLLLPAALVASPAVAPAATESGPGAATKTTRTTPAKTTQAAPPKTTHTSSAKTTQTSPAKTTRTTPTKTTRTTPTQTTRTTAAKTTRSAPTKTTRAAPATPTKPAAAKTTQPPAKNTARARPPAANPCVHVVRSGETVARVASRHGVSRQDLVAVNRVGRSGTLRVGQRLNVPGCVKDASSRDRIASLEIARPEPDLLLARVGPARVPTWLFLGVPQVGAHTVDFAWPVTGTVASPFGRRRSGWHAGVDIKADMGTPIVAAAAGRVIFSGRARSYGRLVKIEHGNGFVTLYAHNQDNLVAVGDQVEAGVVIATVGRSGRSSAAHLHFEIRHGDMVYDPTLFLSNGTLMLARSDEPLDAVTDEDEDE